MCVVRVLCGTRSVVSSCCGGGALSTASPVSHLLSPVVTSPRFLVALRLPGRHEPRPELVPGSDDFPVASFRHLSGTFPCPRPTFPEQGSSQLSRKSAPGGFTAFGRFLFGGPNPPPARFVPAPSSGVPGGSGDGEAAPRDPIDEGSCRGGAEDLAPILAAKPGKPESDPDPKSETDSETEMGTGTPPERTEEVDDEEDDGDGRGDGVYGSVACVGEGSGGGDVPGAVGSDGVGVGMSGASPIAAAASLEFPGGSAAGAEKGTGGEARVLPGSLGWAADSGSPPRSRTQPLSASGGSELSVEGFAAPGSGPEPVLASKSRNRFFASPARTRGTPSAPATDSPADPALALEATAAEAGDTPGAGETPASAGAGSMGGGDGDEGQDRGLEGAERVEQGSRTEPEPGPDPGAKPRSDPEVEPGGEHETVPPGQKGEAVPEVPDPLGDVAARPENPEVVVARPSDPVGDSQDQHTGSRDKSQTVKVPVSRPKVEGSPATTEEGRDGPPPKVVFLSSSRRDKTRRASEAGVAGSGGSGSASSVRNRLSKSRSPGPKKRAARPVLERTASLLSGERKTGLAALEEQVLASLVPLAPLYVILVGSMLGVFRFAEPCAIRVHVLYGTPGLEIDDLDLLIYAL